LALPIGVFDRAEKSDIRAKCLGLSFSVLGEPLAAHAPTAAADAIRPCFDIGLAAIQVDGIQKVDADHLLISSMRTVSWKPARTGLKSFMIVPLRIFSVRSVTQRAAR